jgi:hypothetical protein
MSLSYSFLFSWHPSHCQLYQRRSKSTFVCPVRNLGSSTFTKQKGNYVTSVAMVPYLKHVKTITYFPGTRMHGTKARINCDCLFLVSTFPFVIILGLLVCYWISHCLGVPAVPVLINNTSRSYYDNLLWSGLLCKCIEV